MDSNKPKVVHDLSPMMVVYEDGTIQRFLGNDLVPPSLDDPSLQVKSKDVVFSPENNLSSRIYLPKTISSDQKLPLLVYYHGGAFCIESPFSATYHAYLNKLVEEANIIAVSVDYRLVPEHPIPAAYEDSWAALKWVASHFNGEGSEEWLNNHADLNKVFLAGDSAGGNIAHYIAMRNSEEKLTGVDISGIVLVHPYFWGEVAVGDEVNNLEGRKKIESFWRYTHPNVGLDDPLINPECDPNLGRLGCSGSVLVIVAEKDILKDRGWWYYERLKKSGFKGNVEIMEAKEETHVFHLFKPTCENAIIMLKKIASFLNQMS
ncbi:probable carboxylesterase 12 [Mercurialis annua]|uniref:probable carboxylesterase 12 n=1 Tax=Mercurialis annua TaxID=3986 RepID=UPI00215F14C2|nr:probable carboxylesterase 12 [Mercurialis annua]